MFPWAANTVGLGAVLILAGYVAVRKNGGAKRLGQLLRHPVTPPRDSLGDDAVDRLDQLEEPVAVRHIVRCDRRRLKGRCRDDSVVRRAGLVIIPAACDEQSCRSGCPPPPPHHDRKSVVIGATSHELDRRARREIPPMIVAGARQFARPHGSRCRPAHRTPHQDGVVAVAPTGSGGSRYAGLCGGVFALEAAHVAGFGDGLRWSLTLDAVRLTLTDVRRTLTRP